MSKRTWAGRTWAGRIGVETITISTRVEPAVEMNIFAVEMCHHLDIVSTSFSTRVDIRSKQASFWSECTSVRPVLDQPFDQIEVACRNVLGRGGQVRTSPNDSPSIRPSCRLSSLPSPWLPRWPSTQVLCRSSLSACIEPLHPHSQAGDGCGQLFPPPQGCTRSLCPLSRPCPCREGQKAGAKPSPFKTRTVAAGFPGKKC